MPAYGSNNYIMNDLEMDPTVFLSALNSDEQLDFLNIALHEFNQNQSLPSGGITSEPKRLYALNGPDSYPHTAFTSEQDTDFDIDIVTARKQQGKRTFNIKQESPDAGSDDSCHDVEEERNLTSKQKAQRRAREAQKRFRERQKQKKENMHLHYENLTHDIEYHQSHNAHLSHKNSVMENILEYKEEQVTTLKQAERDLLEEGVLLGPAGRIHPELLEVMQASTHPGAYNLDMLLKYTPGGYSKHLDPVTGLAKESPPFEVVAKEWSEFVQRCRLLLHVASDGAMYPSLATGPVEQHAALPFVHDFGLELKLETAAFIGQDDDEDEMLFIPNDVLGSSGSETFLLNPINNAMNFTAITHNNDFIKQEDPMMITTNNNNITMNNNKNNNDNGTSLSASILPPHRGLMSLNSNTSVTSTRTTSSSSTALEDVLTNVEPRHAVVTDLWNKKGGDLLTMGSKAIIGNPNLDGDINIQNAGCAYRFSPPLIKTTLKLLHTVGCLLWQQSVLFPDNMIRLSALRMDTGEPGEPAALEDVERWRRVLRRLGLRREQLIQITTMHKEFLAGVRPVYRERAAIMQHLQECGSLGAGQNPSVQGHIQASIELGDCASALSQTVHKEYAAWLKLSGGIYRVLDFPVQRTLFITESWPYWPSVNIIGTCAALELDINPLQYNFDDGL